MAEEQRAEITEVTGEVQDNLVRIILQAEHQKKEVYYLLKGRKIFIRYDKEKEALVEEIKKVGEELCNDKGIQSLMLFINPQGVSVWLSNFDEEQTSKFLYELETALARAIFLNYDDWEIKSPASAEVIYYNIVQHIESGYRKAQGGTMLKGLFKAVKVVQTIGKKAKGSLAEYLRGGK